MGNGKSSSSSKTSLSYSVAYTDLIKHVSEKRNMKFENVVVKFRENGIEKRFYEAFLAAPGYDTYNYYIKMLG